MLYSSGQIHFTGFALLIFSGNYAIYVISKNRLQVVLLARNHNLGTSLNCCDIHSISKNQYQVILARYHRRNSQYNRTELSFFLQIIPSPDLIIIHTFPKQRKYLQVGSPSCYFKSKDAMSSEYLVKNALLSPGKGKNGSISRYLA